MNTIFKALLLAGSGLTVISSVGCASNRGDSELTRTKTGEPEDRAGVGGAASSASSAGVAGRSAEDGSAAASSKNDVATVCNEYAAAECHKIAQCNSWFIASRFEDEAACVKRFAAINGCAAWFSLRGTSQTVASLAACTAATKRSTCAEWLDEDASALAACVATPGSLPNGTACANDAQCQSGHCRFGDECGVCGPAPEAGDACRGADDCAAGLSCLDLVCTPKSGAGEPCEGPADCRNSLACSGGRCASPKGPGETCTDYACDAHAGVYCADGVCRNQVYAAPGEPCDWTSGVDCAAGGSCRLSGSNSQGSCVLPAKDGEPCDDQNGPYCLPWATCTGGYCKVPDPAACR